MRLWLSVWLLMAAQATTAQTVTDCALLDRQNVILNPFNSSNRSYANGAVTLGVIHDGRTNSGDSLFLIVFAPDATNPDQKKCRMIGMDEGRGYATIGLQFAQADYSTSTGLTVEVPARIFLMENGFSNTTTLQINVNQAADTINITQELGLE